MEMRKRPIIIICLMLAIVLLAVTGYGKTPPTKITIMLSMFAPEPVRADHPVLKKIEEYTNTDLDLLWVPDKSIGDKGSVMLAANSLPMVAQIGTAFKANYLAAFRAGAFWEIGPYLKSFKNLRKADAGLLQRVSVDGKLYGLPKERQVARIGVTYRKDWADKLGFTKPPKTLDEFYKMAKAFTLNDPDGNGLNDTIGLSEQSSASGFRSMTAWFGASATYGYRNGKVVSYMMEQEYLDAMTFARKLYAEGLVNKDFISVKSKADNLLGGKAGMIIGAIDDAVRNQELIKQVNPQAELDVFSLIDAGKGFHVWPENPGFKGVFAFPKNAVKNVTQLKAILGFFDKLNDKAMNDLIEYGIKGVSYDIVDGKAVYDEEKAEKNGIKRAELDDLSQLRTFRFSINPVTPPQRTPLQERIFNMIDTNLKYVVFDASDGLTSPTLDMRGSELNKMRDDAQAKYIMGLIDLDAFKAEIEKWRKAGGDKVLEELTASYKAVHKIK